MTEEEARVERNRLLALAQDWARRLNARPHDAFLNRQYERAMNRVCEFETEHMEAFA